MEWLTCIRKTIDIIEDNLTEKISGKYNLIVANIVADAIICLSKGVREYMNEDTVYIMSGIIDTRGDEVCEAVSEDFKIVERIEDNGWVCLVAETK